MAADHQMSGLDNRAANTEPADPAPAMM